MSDPETGAREKQFYKAVAEKIQDGNKLLLLGPRVAKHHLLNYLSEQYPALAKKVVGCLVSDQPSDQQIAFCASRILNQPFPDIK